MTRPSPTLSRYTLLTMPEARHLGPSDRRVRRYRLARIQVGGRPSPSIASRTCTAATSSGADGRERLGGRSRAYHWGMDAEKSGPSLIMRIVAVLVLAFAGPASC